jgi:hypothetical protein
MTAFAFDASKVAPEVGIEPLPNGEYMVIITNSLLKKTKAGTGDIMELTLAVVDGPMKGRKIWDRLNVKNPNPTAVQMAQARLSAICHSVGKITFSDTAELHNIPMIAKVKYVPADGQYKPKNEVDSYKPAGAGVQAPPAAANAAPQAQAAPAADPVAAPAAAPAADAGAWWDKTAAG